MKYMVIYIIQSFKQSKGVGRYNRKWHSPVGNIYFSIIFNYKKDFITSMNAYVCYLLHIFFKENYNVTLDYKWPNDLYFNNKKITGILTQNEINGSLCTYKIGVGINVNDSIKVKDVISISLKEILGIKINLLDLSGSIQKHINENIFNPINSAKVSKYLNRYLIKTSTYYERHFNNKKTKLISVISLNNDFSLKIMQDSLIININYGEIF